MTWPIRALLLMCLLVGLSETLDPLCPNGCTAGEYCDESSRDCQDCPSGKFTSPPTSLHFEKHCNKWTFKSGQNVVVIQNGSATHDVIWGCKEGYEKRTVSAAGDWECVLATTTTTTSTSTSTPSTVWRKPETTVGTGSSQDNETNYVIPLSCAVVLTGLAFTLFYVIYNYKKKNRKKKRNKKNSETFYGKLPDTINHELQPLFSAVAIVVGEDERKPFIDVLDDQSKKFDRNQSADFVTLLCKWADCNPEIPHSQCIVSALKEKGFNFKLPDDSVAIDAAEVTNSLNKAGQLNHEFKIFCSELCVLDVGQANELVTKLSIRTNFNNMMHSNSNRIDVTLPPCLAKWAFQFPYVHNRNKDWEALTRLKAALAEIGRNDLEERFDTAAKKVKEKMNIFNPPQCEGALDHNGAAPDQSTIVLISQ